MMERTESRGRTTHLRQIWQESGLLGLSYSWNTFQDSVCNPTLRLLVCGCSQTRAPKARSLPNASPPSMPFAHDSSIATRSCFTNLAASQVHVS